MGVGTTAVHMAFSPPTARAANDCAVHRAPCAVHFCTTSLCTSTASLCAHCAVCHTLSTFKLCTCSAYALTAVDFCALYCASLHSWTFVHLQHTPLHDAAPSSAICNSARLSSVLRAPHIRTPHRTWPLCNSAPHTVHLRTFALLHCAPRAVHHAICALRILHHKAHTASSRTSAAERYAPARTFTPPLHPRPLARDARAGVD